MKAIIVVSQCVLHVNANFRYFHEHPMTFYIVKSQHFNQSFLSKKDYKKPMACSLPLPNCDNIIVSKPKKRLIIIIDEMCFVMMTVFVCTTLWEIAAGGRKKHTAD